MRAKINCVVHIAHHRLQLLCRQHSVAVHIVHSEELGKFSSLPALFSLERSCLNFELKGDKEVIQALVFRGSISKFPSLFSRPSHASENPIHPFMILDSSIAVRIQGREYARCVHVSGLRHILDVHRFRPAVHLCFLLKSMIISSSSDWSRCPSPSPSYMEKILLIDLMPRYPRKDHGRPPPFHHHHCRLLTFPVASVSARGRSAPAPSCVSVCVCV